MKVFVTGGTGFVGAAVVKELLSHGHAVLGLARSERSAHDLRAAGAQVLRGDLETLGALKEGAGMADAVVHAGFLHDFSRFTEACAIDRAAIETLGAALANSGKPLIATAGVAFLDARGAVAVEGDRAFPPSPQYPRASEAAVTALGDRGVAVNLMRLPPSVHGQGDHGFVPMLIGIARQKGVSAYIGEGSNAWPAVHVHDAARAYRLAVERGPSTQVYHAVAEQGIAFREIAEAIATGLGLPCEALSVEQAREHFGWFFDFASIDQAASSAGTREALGWRPDGPGLIADIHQAGYFAARP